jgi:hypothetical protein
MNHKTVRLPVFVALAFAGVVLAGCPKKEEPQAIPVPSASAPAPAASAADTAAATAAPTPVPTHVAPPPTPVVGQSIDSCCSALSAIAKSGRDAATKSKAAMAAGICVRIAPLVKSGQTSRSGGLTQVKSSLIGVTIPPECD